ncbi:signal peptidase I [Isobaculum melis]|uniref:Signal peptidase I n=1 Tax=Isobaculum melis TaxID=142588 RepID=A0A1H9RTY8_9LACT|nr:signal peptidase I [Isobaculum melis]SER76330.1 signal peptidase I [Isobaculum melis]
MPYKKIQYAEIETSAISRTQKTDKKRRIKRKKSKQEWLTNIFVIVIAILLTFWLQYFYFTTTTVKGLSMAPTLDNNQRLIVSKLSFVNRFDIIVFPAPDQEDKMYIKRIIGVPGDHVMVEADVLYINGVAHDEPYLDEYKAALTDKKPFTNDFSLYDLFGVDAVPEGTYFVLGDNRRNSHDGRDIGFISQADIVGEAKVRYWPLNELKYFN